MKRDRNLVHRFAVEPQGRIRRLTSARASTAPRKVTTQTKPPFLKSKSERGFG